MTSLASYLAQGLLAASTDTTRAPRGAVIRGAGALRTEANFDPLAKAEVFAGRREAREAAAVLREVVVRGQATMASARVLKAAVVAILQGVAATPKSLTQHQPESLKTRIQNEHADTALDPCLPHNFYLYLGELYTP